MQFLVKNRISLDVRILGTLICENLHSLYRFQRETLNQLELIQIHHRAMQELIKSNICEEDKHLLFCYPDSAFPIGRHYSRVNAIKFRFCQIEYIEVREKTKRNEANRIPCTSEQMDLARKHASAFNATRSRTLNDRQSTKLKKSEVGKVKINFFYSCNNGRIDQSPHCSRYTHYVKRGSCLTHLIAVHGKTQKEAEEELATQEHEARQKQNDQPQVIESAQ